MLKRGQILQERYQIEEKLGHNIAHEVWLAQDIQIKPRKSVVVKVLLTGGMTQWDEFKLFEREAKILKQLNHPQIPKYLDYFPLDEPIKGFVLIQEYINGTSFKDLISQENRFTESQIKQISKNILYILIYLHELNPPVLHRDIKPSNLILGRDGYIYLIDFGAVQYRAAVEGSTFTVVGTYGYTPIEQFGGRAVAASDIFALGTTLIHLLTGISPADLPQEDFKIQFADRVNLSPYLIRWLEKAIEPDLKNRFDTARKALQALQSQIVNDRDSPVRLSEQSYSSKNLVPPKTDVFMDNSPDELIIKYRDYSQRYIFIIAIFISMLGLYLNTYFPLSFLIISLPAITIAIIYSNLTQISLHFYGNFFAIYHFKNIDNSTKIYSTGFLKDIEDVTQCSMHDANDEIKNFISIKTKEQEYIFGQGLSKAECIWLVQEIKNWLEQKKLSNPPKPPFM